MTSDQRGQVLHCLSSSTRSARTGVCQRRKGRRDGDGFGDCADVKHSVPVGKILGSVERQVDLTQFFIHRAVNHHGEGARLHVGKMKSPLPLVCVSTVTLVSLVDQGDVGIRHYTRHSRQRRGRELLRWMSAPAPKGKTTQHGS